MKRVLPIAVVGAVLMAGLTLSGCTGHNGGGRYGDQGVEEHIPDPDDYYQGPEPDFGPPDYIAPVPGGWTCVYDPTMNNDWHDDVLCRNMDATDRPYLLPGDSFVTQDEIMAAARDYESSLNASSGATDCNGNGVIDWRDFACQDK